ncbi:MAG TPA: hypothetical protein VJK51_01815 [Candidatus Nanoarchaeia archaeon]|nr:hypothetical protein [Candidatus Nanoarchaeia archaeon]
MARKSKVIVCEDHIPRLTSNHVRWNAETNRDIDGVLYHILCVSNTSIASLFNAVSGVVRGETHLEPQQSFQGFLGKNEKYHLWCATYKTNTPSRFVDLRICSSLERTGVSPVYVFHDPYLLREYQGPALEELGLPSSSVLQDYVRGRYDLLNIRGMGMAFEAGNAAAIVERNVRESGRVGKRL